MAVEKQVQQLVIADLGIVKVHFDNFSVTSRFTADFLVSRVFGVSTHVTYGRINDSLLFPKAGFDTPETPCPECGFLNTHFIISCVIPRAQ
jgi:hypothetical protein